MAGVIWSHQRCGSSNLQRFAGAAANVPVGNEPFNRKALKNDFPGFESEGIEAFQRYVSDVCGRYGVVKYIYGVNRVEFDEAVAASGNIPHIVMLYRQNSFAAALSNLIARQTETYRSRPDRPLRKIRPNEIRQRASLMEYRRDVAKLILRYSGKPYTVISYEELFAATECERREKAQEILRLLVPGVQVAAADFEAAYDEWLSPDRKYNSPESYSLIENYDQLKREFDFMS